MNIFCKGKSWNKLSNILLLLEDTPDSDAHDCTFLRRFCFPFPPPGSWVPAFQAEDEVQEQEPCFLPPRPCCCCVPQTYRALKSLQEGVGAPQPAIYGASLKTHAPECLLAQALIPWRCVTSVPAAQTCSAEK